MNDLPDEMWCEILSFLPLRERRSVEGTSKKVLRLVRSEPDKISREIQKLFSYHNSLETDLSKYFTENAFEYISTLGVHLACECDLMDLEGRFPSLETLFLYRSAMFVRLSGMDHDCEISIEKDKSISVCYMYQSGIDLESKIYVDVFCSPPTLKKLVLDHKLTDELHYGIKFTRNVLSLWR